MKLFLLFIGISLALVGCDSQEEHPYYEKLEQSHNAMMAMMEGNSTMPMPMGNEKVIAVLLYDGFTLLDATGPLQSLTFIEGAKIVTVAKNKGEIASDSGIKMTADYSFKDLNEAYMVVVPGGLMGTIAASKDQETLEWLRKIDKTTTYTTSVCTGAWILGASGLLEGKNASTQWSGKDYLEKFGARYTGERYTVDGKYITSAGVTSGIDMGLMITGMVEGDDAAKAAQLVMEYDPMPPYDSGTPSKADPELVRIMLKMNDDHMRAAESMPHK